MKVENQTIKKYLLNKKILIISFFNLFMFTNCYGQNKSDYIWFGGRDSQAENGIEGFMLDFNDGALSIEPLQSALSFDMNNVSICDKDGKLLFYSNGCAVANVDHEIMENGEGINDGEFFEFFWEDDCKNGYPGLQDILAIPDPNEEYGYYLLTKPVFVDDDIKPYKDVIQYSYIEMSKQNGMGEVMVKNDTIISGTNILSGYFSAVQAVDESWWVLQVTENPIQIVKLKIDQDGIRYHSSQTIGIDLHEDASASGLSRFSPDGSIYAFYNRFDQLNLFDFDKESGLLSNFRKIDVANPTFYSSIEFSPNGRFLYVSTIDSLFQVDLQEVNVENQIEFIGDFNGVQNPQFANIYLLKRAPDCRIYVAASSESRTYGVINYPNHKGLGCEFVQQAVELPYKTGRVSLPNFPNYRINELEVCDSTIVGVYSTIDEVYNYKPLLYPNPTIDILNVLLPFKVQHYYMIVTNLLGQIVIKQEGSNSSHQLNVGHLKAGIYHLQIDVTDHFFEPQTFIVIEN